jgi:hypothetical protein
LYTIFINGIVQELKAAGLGSCLDGVWMGCLLYADDTALVADSEEELRAMLSILDTYSRKWRFRINAAKSKVMICNDEDAKKRDWRVGGSVMEVVSYFKYLGVEIAENGSWRRVAKRFITKAARRCNFYINLGMRSLGVNAQTAAKLWSACIKPVMTYGSEVWCPTQEDARRMQSEQNRAARSILGFNKASTVPTAVLHGELGWMPMASYTDLACLRFYAKLMRMPTTRLVRRVYDRRRAHHDEKRYTAAWCERARTTFCKFDLEQYWNTPDDYNAAWCDVAGWNTYTADCVANYFESKLREALLAPKLSTWYGLLKDEPSTMEPYLTLRDKRAVRIITKLRSGCCLEIEEYRRGSVPVPRHLRFCKVCSSWPECEMGVGDITHFICSCPMLGNIRKNMWDALRKFLLRAPRGNEVWNAFCDADDSDKAMCVLGKTINPVWDANLCNDIVVVCAPYLRRMWEDRELLLLIADTASEDSDD